MAAVIVPPHVVLAFPETIMPLGKLSVSGAVKLATVLLGLFKVMVSVEDPPGLMVAGLKALPSVSRALAGITFKSCNGLIGVIAFIGLQCANGQFVTVVTFGLCGHINFHSTGALGWNIAPLQDHLRAAHCRRNRPTTSGTGFASDHQTTRKAIGERCGQVGNRAVRVLQGNGKR